MYIIILVIFNIGINDETLVLIAPIPGLFNLFCSFQNLCLAINIVCLEIIDKIKRGASHTTSTSAIHT